MHEEWLTEMYKMVLFERLYIYRVLDKDDTFLSIFEPLLIDRTTHP